MAHHVTCQREYTKGEIFEYLNLVTESKIKFLVFGYMGLNKLLKYFYWQ